MAKVDPVEVANKALKAARKRRDAWDKLYDKFHMDVSKAKDDASRDKAIKKLHAHLKVAGKVSQEMDKMIKEIRMIVEKDAKK